MSIAYTYALSNATILSLLTNQALGSSANGTGRDIRQLKGDALAILDVGVSSGTTPSLIAKLQESDNNAAWSDVPGAVFATVTTAASLQSIVVRPGERKKYLRVVVTVDGGGSPSFPVACHLVGLALVA